MKNVKNYVAPKAEVIELDVNKDIMAGTVPSGTGSTPTMSQTSSNFNS